MPADNLTFANLTASTSDQTAAAGFRDGFAHGFHAGVTQVKVLVFFLLFSYIIQAVMLWVGRRFEMADAWYETVVPTYRHAAFVVRLGICAALVTETYFIL